MELRGTLRRLPLAGVAAAGAVTAHTLAYALAAPQTGARVALLATTGHAYWTAAIAAALVLGVLSLAATLTRHFRAGLAAGPAAAGEPLGRLAVRLTWMQVAIFLVQEVLERVAAGLPPAAWVDGRLLGLGLLVQVLVGLGLAAVLAWAGRAAEAAGRALRQPRPLRPTPAPRRPHPVSFARPSRLLAAGLGGRAPPLG
jgi:hypothetical protein